ncbi:MAG TPA: fused MFS/spermidine synthase, partial [Gammaproteobacteria bacterium]|nr:fused MFS/spermidine synthase [Gammaproteobacteria bacterium]
MVANSRGVPQASRGSLFKAGATAGLFFASGFAALIYQIVWQRSLFTIFGINVEAVTVVVSGFIAGLGLGSLVGGWLSRTLRGHLLLVFGVIEIAIGLFGALSLQLFEWVGVRTLLLPAAAIAAGTIGVILLPTLLMGATLPILTQHLIHRRQNVGWSVGLLYSANTFGSATAGFASAFWLMGALGMQGAVLLAATVNLTVGLTALLFFYGSINSDSFPSSTYERAAAEQRPSPSLNLVAIALGVSALTGYIALSYEVLWFRAFLVATNRAPAFALILATYLTGVAIGSYGAREYCASRPTNQQLMFILSLVILLSSAIGFLVLPLAAKLAAGGMGFFVATILALVVIQTSVAGAVLPLICHSLIPPGPSTGIWVSSVYAAN